MRRPDLIKKAGGSVHKGLIDESAQLSLVVQACRWDDLGEVGYDKLFFRIDPEGRVIGAALA